MVGRKTKISSMKVLLTLPRPLFPPDTGGKIRSLNILSRLAKRVEVHAVSLADPACDGPAITAMEGLFKSYVPVPWHEAKQSSFRFYSEVVRNQFNSLPYFLSKCDRPAFRSAVRGLIDRQHFDLLLCDFLHTAAPLREINFKPRIVFEHNVEFLLRKRKAALEARPIHKVILETEWKKTKRIEIEVCRSFDHVVAVSPEDEATFRKEFAIDHVSAVPTGVDTGFFRPDGSLPVPGRLSFVGSMDWAPNEDGIVWFLREAYPQVRRALPYVTLSVVGRNPSPRLRAIAGADPTIEITGCVPDVRPYLSQAEVVIVPLRIAGGTRIKIPEAMAMTKAVVSTQIGAEGLPFRDGRDIVIADTAGGFAQSVVRLLLDTSARRSIETAARETLVNRFSWDAVVDRFEQVLEHALASARSHAFVA